MFNHSANEEKKKKTTYECSRHGHRPRNDSFNTEPSSHADGAATSADTAAGDSREAELQRKSQ